MRTKRRGLFAVTAVAVFMAALLFTNCVAPTDPTRALAPQRPELPTTVPPVGMGYLRLNVVDELARARTILPGPDDIPDLADLFFRVEIATTPTGGTLAGFETAVTGTAAINDILLEDGTYYVRIFAFRQRTLVSSDPDVYQLEQLVARSRVDPPISVEIDGANESVTVPMIPIPFNDPLAGDPGTFAWNIELPPTLSVATMTLTPLETPGGAPVLTGTAFATPMDLLTGGNITGSEPIPAGFYRMVIRLERATGHEVRIVQSVLHIYQNMESHFGRIGAAEVIPAPNALVQHIITFIDYNRYGADTHLYYSHAQLLTAGLEAPGGAPGFAALPGTGTLGFLGWYRVHTSPDTWAGQWDLATDRVNRSINLYARWVPRHLLTFNLQNIAIGDLSPQVGDITFNTTPAVWSIVGQPAGTTLAVLTIANVGALDADSITWTTIDWLTEPRDNLITLGTGATLNLNFDTQDLFNAPATYGRYINIEATSGAGTIRWSASVRINSTPTP